MQAVLWFARTKIKECIFMGSILETLMLVCFGFSWPLNVMKAFKAKTAKGTSLPFILLIVAGYIAGIQLKSRPVWTVFMALFFSATAFASSKQAEWLM